MRVREAEDRRRENQLVPGLLVYWFSHVRSVIEDTHVFSVLHTSSCFYTRFSVLHTSSCFYTRFFSPTHVLLFVNTSFQCYTRPLVFKHVLSALHLFYCF